MSPALDPGPATRYLPGATLGVPPVTAQITIAMAQANPTVGDIEGNLALARRLRADAARRDADLVVFPELMLIGYPPEDLVLKPALCAYARHALEQLARDTGDGGPAVVMGAPWREPDGALYNAAFLLHGGAIAGRVFKHALPNYGVFDEKRVFAAGPIPGPLPLPLKAGGTIRLGVMVCEDMWSEDVAEGLGESGAQILVVPNGSPFEHGKVDQRLQLAVARVTETGLPLLYVNQVGGQDELVFDGGVVRARRAAAAGGAGAGLRRDAEPDDMAQRGRRGLGAGGAGRDRGAAAGAGDDLSGDGAGPARLCRQEPLPRRGAGPLGRNRFGDLRPGGGGCARAGPGARRDDAVALHLARQPGRRGRLRAAAGHQAGRDRDRARGGGVRRHAGAGVRGPGAGHDRGEPAVAHPRRALDGDLQQARAPWC